MVASDQSIDVMPLSDRVDTSCSEAVTSRASLLSVVLASSSLPNSEPSSIDMAQPPATRPSRQTSATALKADFRRGLPEPWYGVSAIRTNMNPDHGERSEDETPVPVNVQ
jgi:hypothetical protein